LLNQTRAGGWDFSLKQSSILKEHPAWRASYVERPSQKFYPWCNVSKIPKHYSQLFQAQFDWFFKKCSFLPFENAIKPLAFILVRGLPLQPRSFRKFIITSSILTHNCALSSLLTRLMKKKEFNTI
jgi:hypothetical protein